MKNPFERILEFILQPLLKHWSQHKRETFFKPLTQRTVYYCVIPGRYAKFVAMAKLEPFTSDNPNPMTEPGDLWFELGETRAEAYWKITDEMIKLGLEKDVIFCGGGEEGKR